MADSRRQGAQFFPIFLFFLGVVLLFIGGIAALLYWAFTEFAGFRNVWVLVCCFVPGVILAAFVTIYSLYARYGRPFNQIVKAVDSVSTGDLSVRVEEDDSPQFGQLIKRFNAMVEELQRADRQRRDLTADIAHELRTPLHILQGKLEGIQDGVYAATPEHIGEALDETRLLTRLVEDLQTLSLAESGQLELHKTRFQLGDLLQDVVASFAAQAETAQVELTYSLDGELPDIEADYLRLNQVLTNLVSNALRYTPAGGRVVLVGEVGQAVAHIRVQDSGTGIAPEDLPYIFDRFWRAERARTRSGQSNSGLGLAISRQLVLAHGGSIHASSALGAGTEFVIELPQKAM